ncbi:MAG: hypothetical protein HGA63_00170 [Syntrophobacteraceae bacterium]|nr:hypothetical protein [Syntrophobacteraceae bacterium]
MSPLDRIQEASQYFSTLLRRRPDFVEWLWGERKLYRRFPVTELYGELKDGAQGVDSFMEVLRVFREFKQRHFLRIGGRDLLGIADLSETTAQLSDLACVSLQVGLEILSVHLDWWLTQEDIPAWAQWKSNASLIVMGLGKLGGHELNYVSDVDLLFLNAPRTETDQEHRESLVVVDRLCRFLTKLQAENVEGDRVFQVDLRLRPQGKDGPLVPPLSAAADYYLNCGRPWERQMLLKARPVAGDRSLGMSFLHEVRPFVFRRFLDFQALDELKAMRDRILAEGVRPSPGWKQFDVKLGVGGIREVEFLVQSLQLIYGGRHPELDEPNTLRCISRLEELGLLSPDVAAELKESYTFLRRVEHWVQLDQNRQTQKLPQSPEAQGRLARALGFEDYAGEFLSRLEHCCALVHRRFLDLFQGEGSARSLVDLDEESEPEAVEDTPLEAIYPNEPLSRMQSRLEAFPASVRLPATKVLREFAAVRSGEVHEKVLVRLDRYVSQAAKRPGLLKLFQAGASWFSDVCSGIARSEMLADLLAHNPSLVEGVSSKSGCMPDHEAWEAACFRLLRSTESYEEGLEWIRRLKSERVLQLVLADLRGELPSSDLERNLSALADLVIVLTYEQVRRHLGLPSELPLCVLALGRLGSEEMNYLSDLDLVFVYSPGEGVSENEIPPDVIRLVQRFMRMLSTPLQEGPGYSVDARLRPTGSYGPLIVTRNSWLDYYCEEADLWEIQALLRVRCVAGDRVLGQWIEEKAEEICYKERTPSAVWGRLCPMRRRMEKERAEEKGDFEDIKLGAGGLADLEFVVQGIQLIEGWNNDDLRNRSIHSVLPIALEAGIGQIPAAIAACRDFGELRKLEQRLRLHTNFATSRISPSQFAALRDFGLWPPAGSRVTMESWDDFLRMRRRVRAVFDELCRDA